MIWTADIVLYGGVLTDFPCDLAAKKMAAKAAIPQLLN